MNEQSSRSHGVVRLKNVRKTKGKTPIVTYLTFVDLAGSERQTDAKTTGERLKEASSINKSLSTLGSVIFALGKPGNDREHVPFRDSKLTLLLRNSLDPATCETCVVVNVSPCPKQYFETTSTLKFARRVKMIKGTAGGKFDAGPNPEVADLVKEIGRLKMELTNKNAEEVRSY